MKSVFSLCVGALVFLCGVVSADPLTIYTQEPEKTVLDTIEKSFVTDTKHSLTFDTSGERATSPSLKTVWIGNEPEVELSLTKANLEFQQEGDRSPFTLTVEYRPKELFVWHSAPTQRKMKGGVLFPYENEGVYQGHLPGRGNTGVSVFFSPVTEEPGEKPVMLCLGRLAKRLKSRQQFYYEGKPTKLIRANFSAGGRMSGALNSGHGKGYIRAEFFSSDGVIPSYPAFDEVLAKDPFTGIRYVPQKKKISALVVADDSLFSAAALARLTMRNAAGYQYLTDNYQTLWFKKTKVPADFAFTKRNARSFWSNSPCWILYRNYGIIRHFSKTEKVINE